MSYVSLHTHSVFSFHAGVCTIRDLVTRARSLGMHALALTDTDRMSGLILFYIECLRQGIKPIPGVELTRRGDPSSNIVLLARNARGYGDVCEIITRRHLDSPPYSLPALCADPRPDLLFLTNTPSLLRLLAAGPNRERTYAELINTSAYTRERSREVARLASSLGIPPVVSNDVYFLDESDWHTHRILRAIGLNSTLSRLAPREYASPHARLRPARDMYRLFPDHAEAVARTEEIARRCEVTLELGRWILPHIDVPRGYTPEGYLHKQAWEGLERNYRGSPSYRRAAELQRMELEVIGRLGYASYFLIVKDIRDWAARRFAAPCRTSSLCTILRGSAANAITFYNLGVSELDPIRHNLYFHRFLNEDRASPPDADLDFGWDERDEALEYMAAKWGRDRVAITCTTNHFRRRAALRETAKVYGYSDEQVSELLAGRVSSRERIEDTEIAAIVRDAEKLRGKPRFPGQHPGGLLITNDPLRRHVACQYTGGAQQRVITQVDMHNGTEELGLIKFDILGNGSLSVVRDTLGQIHRQHLPDPGVDDREKCCRDPRVREIIRNGRTRGIFYIESPAQMRLNKKAQACDFDEITVTSSLIRPAGTAWCSRYVERHRKMKLGVKDWEFLHPSLEPILGETHDVCAFQEDVTKICRQVAGLSYKEADRIRKQMNCSREGAVQHKEWERTARNFIEGCGKHTGLTRKQAVELWERVASFSGFSFCKSHSAGYAALSFRCTYLKAYYPAQFLAAVISNNHGFYTREVYLEEARRWGIRILPLHVNHSAVAYEGKHAWIRPGLMHIRGLRRESMEGIVTERRRRGPYANLVDFLRRTDTHRKEIEHLVLVGAFDGFGMTRPELLYLLDGVYDELRPKQPSLFGNEGVYRTFDLHPGLTDYSLTQRCIHELELLGFMLSGNILDILDLHPCARDAVPAADIKHFEGRRVKLFGRPITRRVHHTADGGRAMMFLTLEDRSECADVILWPDIYERYPDLLGEPGPFEIEGKVTGEWDTYSVEARSIRSVRWSPAQVDFQAASKRLEQSFVNYRRYEDIRQAA